MKNIGMVIVVAAMIATGCRMDTRYPLIPTASAATMDTPSNTTRIDIDLGTAHTDTRYPVRGTQIYYDLGLEPSKAGAISVKTNSILSPAITLAPGGSITFTGLTDIYVTNVALPGKSAVLLVSQQSVIANNSISTISSGLSDRYGLGQPGNLPFNFTVTIPPQVNTLNTFNLLLPSDNPRGVILYHTTLAITHSSPPTAANPWHHDYAQLTINGQATGMLMWVTGDRADSIDDVFLPPGTPLTLLYVCDSVSVPTTFNFSTIYKIL